MTGHTMPSPQRIERSGLLACAGIDGRRNSREWAFPKWAGSECRAFARHEPRTAHRETGQGGSSLPTPEHIVTSTRTGGESR